MFTDGAKEALDPAGCLRSASLQTDSQPGTGRENWISTPYEDLVKIVKNHYDPKPSVTMQKIQIQHTHEDRWRIDRNVCRSPEGASSTLRISKENTFQTCSETGPRFAE